MPKKRKSKVIKTKEGSRVTREMKKTLFFRMRLVVRLFLSALFYFFGNITCLTFFCYCISKKIMDDSSDKIDDIQLHQHRMEIAVNKILFDQSALIGASNAAGGAGASSSILRRGVSSSY